MSTTLTVNESIARLAGKYLTFELGNETYGLPILNVQEIIGMMPVTRVPRTPRFVRGVVNLRGRVIPVIALRRKFDLEDRDDDERTCIIVIQMQLAESQLIIGAIVDEVSEVLNIEADLIEEPPEFGSDFDMDFILGIGKVNKKIVMLLDTNRILTTSELGLTAKAASMVQE